MSDSDRGVVHAHAVGIRRVEAGPVVGPGAVGRGEDVFPGVRHPDRPQAGDLAVPMTVSGPVLSRWDYVQSVQYTGAAVTEPASPHSRQTATTPLQKRFVLIHILLDKKIGLASLPMNAMRSTTGRRGFPMTPSTIPPEMALG